MGLIANIRNRIKNKTVTVTKYKMISDEGDGFYAWDGKLYKSDIVRAAIRPKARAIGKAVGKHIRETLKQDGTRDIAVNPDVYLRFLLEEPNEWMTGQMLQEKLAIQLELNNNAFAYIDRDSNGLAKAIYPLNASMCEALQDNTGRLYIKFTRPNGKSVTLAYSDLIHLRKDFNSSDIFGDSAAGVLTPLMEVVNATDQGVVKAIKNSMIIRWLLKFHNSLRKEDIEQYVKDFSKSFLDTEGEGTGVAGVDAKADAQQVDSKEYIPNAAQMDKTTQRIYGHFNTNDKIVHGSYTEDEWISYFESAVEPDIIQLSNEYTRKIFSRRERGYGNKIIFEASSLAFASMTTKLNLVQLVDRGIMVPNEMRAIFNWAPIPGGDQPIRRLDTRPTTE